MSDNIESSSYFYRIISLVIDVGTETLRGKFYSIVPKSDVQTYFSQPLIKSEFGKLKFKKRLTNVQYEKVTVSPDPDSYDISLLITLLINHRVCRIPPPRQGWSQIPPDPSDQTIGADLLRLREVRNEIVGHRPTAQLNKADFLRLWSHVEAVLLRIAVSVDSTEEVKIKRKVQDAENQVLEPLHDREKKLMHIIVQWHKEDSEKYQAQLAEVQNSLETLHIKVDSIPRSRDETDACRSDDTFNSLESQVSSLVQSFGSIARQDCVIQMQEKLKSMCDMVKNICQTQQMVKQQYDAIKLCLETISKQMPATVNQQTSLQYQQNADWAPAKPVRQPTDAKPKTNVTNPNAMSEKYIDKLSRQIANDWEPLRIHLDFTEAQSHALTKAHNNDIQHRIYVMLKSWHDVVVECGENPKMLLAAAFVNSSSNYAMAYKLVPREQFKENASAKPTTIERIECITFCKDGHYIAEGDGMHQGGGMHQPYGNTSMHHGGSGSVNVYGGNVKLEGSVAIHSTPASQSYSMSDVSSVSSDGRSGGQHGSFNVYDGNVVMGAGSSIVIGPPGHTYPAQMHNQPAVRGERLDIHDNPTVAGMSLPSSTGLSGHPFKKETDDTLCQAMVAALHEQMKSVGVLISNGNTIGTVFRVGSRFVMTALHVVKAITGGLDLERDTFINFNESPVTPPVKAFRLKKTFIANEELDVAVLEISNPSNLPMKMNLQKTDVDAIEITNVSLIGYGHPGQSKKCLDPKCQIILPMSQRIQSAHAWLQNKRAYYRLALQEIGRNPELVDNGYLGYDSPGIMLINCYMEQGASGAPALTNNNDRSVEVVGMLTRGLPEFYYSLPNIIKPNFPNDYRFESSTKMKSIFEWISETHPELVTELF